MSFGNRDLKLIAIASLPFIEHSPCVEIRAADASVPVTIVHATRGKFVRAEPVAQLYEQGRVRHVGAYPALEDEMCDFGLDGLSSGRSPDRLDALVWALTALTYGVRAEPRVRGI